VITGRLNRYEVIMIRQLSGIESLLNKRDSLVFNSFRNFKPVKRFHN